MNDERLRDLLAQADRLAAWSRTILFCAAVLFGAAMLGLIWGPR